MFDVRYHALSLVAVFIALAIGLLLGVAIGDEGLVSSAERRLREDLRADVRDAQRAEADARRELQDREEFEREVYPAIVRDRLDGQRILVLGLGGAPDTQVRAVRQALEGTGARLAAVGVVRLPPRISQIAERAGDTRYSALADDPELLAPFGRRIGRQLILGGKLVRTVRGALLSGFSGQLDGAEAVVVTRPRRELEGDDRVRADNLERSLLDGIATLDIPVVGVEATSTDPSQVGFYDERDVSSVDNVDTIAGRVALVYALAGARGAFGVKESAGALLPRTLGEP